MLRRYLNRYEERMAGKKKPPKTVDGNGAIVEDQENRERIKFEEYALYIFL
jgi:hypothetical protein